MGEANVIHRRRSYPPLPPTPDRLKLAAAIAHGRVWHNWSTGRVHRLAGSGQRMELVTDEARELFRAGWIVLSPPAGSGVLGQWRLAARGRTALAVFLLGYRPRAARQP